MKYEIIKNLAKKLLPNRLIHQNQLFIRKIIALQYRGDRYECNICNYKLSKFIKLSNGDLLCPNCGSLPRTRRLWYILESEIANGHKQILHFSPSKSIARKLKKVPNIDYITTDYVGEFEADQHFDITSIDEPDGKYDLIICFHVLEHIEKDAEAIKELFRVLKKGGKCFLQTPFKDGEIYENPAIQTSAERLEHFGQEDHVRIYSVAGLSQRIEKEGFDVRIETFHEERGNKYGLKEQEVVIIGRKT